MFYLFILDQFLKVVHQELQWIAVQGNCVRITIDRDKISLAGIGIRGPMSAVINKHLALSLHRVIVQLTFIVAFITEDGVQVRLFCIIPADGIDLLVPKRLLYIIADDLCIVDGKVDIGRMFIIFIADDNFAGDKKYTRELLRQLIPLNNSFKIPIEFITQIDITIANDEELLMLLADCNFQAVMIGIESVNEDSLKDYNKQQNLRFPVREAVQKIQSYGIIVLAHMIIGADSDDSTVFAKTEEFIANTNIVHHLCHPLAAPPGTKMWYELKRAGRIIHTDTEEIADKLDIISNIIPKQMTRVELFEGLANYWESIYDPKKFTQRAITFLDGVKYKPKIKEPGLRDLWTLRKMLWRVFTFFMYDAGKEHKKAFFTILRATQKKGMYLLPKIIYIYTCYLVDYNRSMYDAKIARSHAQWERENGHKLVIDNDPIPVAEMIREHATPIFNAAYQHIRGKVAKKEILYTAIVSAMVDYNDRFGKTFETFDTLQEEHIRDTCDRIINTLPPNGHASTDDMPPTPPAGFTREILDALDNAVRYQRSNN